MASEEHRALVGAVAEKLAIQQWNKTMSEGWDTADDFTKSAMINKLTRAAGGAVKIIEPLIREQIATELRRNRVASAKTPYSQGYRDGYNDAADQVQHGGDAALSDHTPSTGGRGSLPRLAHDFQGVSGHPDDDECTYREDGTDATYCGHPEADHG